MGAKEWGENVRDGNGNEGEKSEGAERVVVNLKSGGKVGT
jgi:hypothetical protein